MQTPTEKNLVMSNASRLGAPNASPPLLDRAKELLHQITQTMLLKDCTH